MANSRSSKKTTPFRTKVLFVFGLGMILFLTMLIIGGTNQSLSLNSNASAKDQCKPYKDALDKATAKVDGLEKQKDDCNTTRCMDDKESKLVAANKDSKIAGDNYMYCLNNSGPTRTPTPIPDKDLVRGDRCWPIAGNPNGACPAGWECKNSSPVNSVYYCMRLPFATKDGNSCLNPTTKLPQNSRCADVSTVCNASTGDCNRVAACSYAGGICKSNCGDVGNLHYQDISDKGFCTNRKEMCCLPSNKASYEESKSDSKSFQYTGNPKGGGGSKGRLVE